MKYVLQKISTELIGWLTFLSMLVPGCCYAIDPSFELAPAQIKEGITVKNSKQQRNLHTQVKKSSRKRPSRHLRTVQAVLHAQDKSRQSFYLSPLTPESVSAPRATSQQLYAFWEKLIPFSREALLQPFEFRSDAFELSLDPDRYPQLKTVDGRRLLVDTQRRLPPLVRSLIEGKDKSVTIVQGSTADDRSFLNPLLKSAGFFSVEERPVMSFGDDPKLKIRTDFKVERTPESILHNEVLLISASRTALPVPLSAALQKYGVVLLEPFASETRQSEPQRHQIIRFGAGPQPEMLDTLLTSVGVNFEKNQKVELYQKADSGIRLSVAADRYFEYRGSKYVVANFSGDPVAFTLLRLLELKGFKVVLVTDKDDFRSLTGQLLTKMGVGTPYSNQKLVVDSEGRYSIDMSGYLLENRSSGGGMLVLTDRIIEKNMQDILNQHGYQIQESGYYGQ